ncbi:unnamed protein product [Vicia faba]|uniref:Uncharacterized protein n=1 Tax=Vicia faba TaxID=3906 RepID=A0AAV0ZLJ0_VICFA|nr:unnamed protein product [Vicia faba]
MLPREDPGSCSTQLLNVKQEPHEQRGPNLPSTPIDLSFHIGLTGAESVRNIPASSRVEAGDHSLESSEVRPPLKPQPSGTIKAKSEDNHEKLDGCSTSNVADNARAINGNVSCGPNNYRQKGPRIAKVVRRINCNFEPLEFGIVFSGKSGAEFIREMQRHSVAIRQLLHYKGQPDPLKGDALNKAVRDTANEAVSVMFYACEEKIRATVVKEITDDSHVKSLPSPDFHNNLRNSPIVDSLCQPALLDPGSELKNGILQIEDNFYVLKDSSADGTGNSTIQESFYPESGQSSSVLITSTSPKDVPDLLSKGNSVSIKDTCPVDNPGQTNNDGQEAVEVDYITESTLLPSQTNRTTTTSNCITNYNLTTFFNFLTRSKLT